MTHDMEKTIDFMKSSARAANLPAGYGPDIERGISEGKKEIPLPHAWVEYPKENAGILWEPKLTEQEKKPGRYNFGYLATLAVEGKEPVKQYFSIFNLTGATLEQSKALLEGKTVVMTEWDNKQAKRRDVVASLDMSQTPPEGKNYPVTRIPLEDLRLGVLLSKEDVVGDQNQKSEYLKQLQQGERVEVSLRHFVDKVPKLYDASLQLNIVNDAKGLRLEMTVRDPEGKVLRQPSIEPKQANSQIVGLVVGMDGEKKMPESLLKLLAGGKMKEGQGIDNKAETPDKRTPKIRA